MIEKRLATSFHLENIDVLDYRIAANILETASDTLVEIANALATTSISKSDLKKIFDLTRDIENIHRKSIDAFIARDRRMAIEAISNHRKFQKKISDIRSSIEQKKQIPLNLLDLIYMFERVSRSWSDIADLVKPIYDSQ